MKPFTFIFFLLCVSFSIQPTFGANACWDCSESSLRGLFNSPPSSESSSEGEIPVSDTVPATNALDSLFRDPPQDALVPPKKDTGATNQNGQADNGTNNNSDKGGENSVNDASGYTSYTPLSRWSGTDTLVVIFFVVASIWLIAATVYSITLFVLIRLQARGELDIYDENLGLWIFCNGRFSLHFGCILRRYAIQLERDYQRRLQQRYGNPDGDTNGETLQVPSAIRIMTREERRKAVEVLLGIEPAKVQYICCAAKGRSDAVEAAADEKDVAASGPASPAHSLESSQEGPVCSICLDGYETTDVVFKSTSCAHMFHKDCLMEWLERRNNTECPCCRDPLVSDEDVWTTVKRLRKERRRQLRKENGYAHRVIQWMLSKRRQRQMGSATESPNSTTSMGSTSSEEDDPELQRGEGTESSVDVTTSSSSVEVDERGNSSEPTEAECSDP